MPKSPEKLGELIQSRLFQMRKRSDQFFKELETDLKRLNKMTTRVTNKLYDQVLSSLETLQGTSMPINTIGNLSQVSVLMQGLDAIQNDYRHAYGQLIRNARLDMLEIVITREAALEKVLRDEEGIIEDRTIVSDQAFEMMDVGYQKTLQRMNVILDKWKSFAYDTFYSGLIKGVPISLFKSWFFNDDGTLKIGSSLDEESTYTAVQSIVEQRTTYLRGKAQENGWKYCWNSNPMDPLTKSECIDATIAGVISEAEMGSGYGFPPRYICRCEIVYTRPEWVRVNKGVNSSIEKSRLSLVQQLINAPRQKGKWTRGGKTVTAKDITRAQGNLMYKEVEDKLGLLADRGPVPDFDFDTSGLLPPELLSSKGLPSTGKEIKRKSTKFIPVDEIKDAEKWAKQQGIVADYSNLTIEEANLINEGVHKAQKVGLTLPKSIKVDGDLFQKGWSVGNVNESVARVVGHKELQINDYSPLWDELSDEYKNVVSKKWWAVPQKTGTVTHEIAHIHHGTLFAKKYGDEAWVNWGNSPVSFKRRLKPLPDSVMKPINPEWEKILNEVSGYAGKNKAEFVAEVASGMLHGKKYSKVVMDLFDKSLGKGIKWIQK